MYRTESFKVSQSIAQNISIPEYTIYSVNGKGFFSRTWANYNTSLNFKLMMKIIVDGVQINDSDATYFDSMRFLTHEVTTVTVYDNNYMLRIPFDKSLVIKISTTAPSSNVTMACSGQIMVEV